ncbi:MULTISPECIES: DUF123 domain-containing protein [Metallosphaera]|uniref:GIY-YIG nuclease family protein n=1 Tax=Metallosphaera TaxID=41980 RepID=UPI001F0555BC|nr:DUF123 domain-containing protein [Metallosphaera sedula]MCH1770137.1 DUF123 domain-containing protein [Metallosphaera sedula]MCP6728029.1 DUF123 domain-containing protein [Metallosphaera sedula]
MKWNRKGYAILFDCENGEIRTSGRVFSITRGTYAYVGSCGVNCGKRVGRHLSDSLAKRRWHVDYLKDLCKPLGALVLPLTEEDIANILTDPVKGFGSSDCRKHEGHLFRVEIKTLLSRLAQSQV